MAVKGCESALPPYKWKSDLMGPVAQHFRREFVLIDGDYPHLGACKRWKNRTLGAASLPWSLWKKLGQH
jgi:hypothetical protein